MRELEEELRKHSFELLLSEFRHTPKDVYRRTLLELTNYTGRRYEETISQLLAFFLDPKNEHGFETLMINALLESLGLDIVGENENINVSTEVSTPELKRIDLLVETESCLLVIENKIYAELYNDIKYYRRYGELHKSKKNLLCVVLSLRRLSEQEHNKAVKESFKVIYYDHLFIKLSRNLKSLIAENHAFIFNEYYVFLNDIIKTINKKAFENMTTEIDKFLLRNKVEIDLLIKSRDSFLSKVSNLRMQVARAIVDQLNEKSEFDNNKWWDWHKKDDSYNLYFGYKFEGKFPREFGIECIFEEPVINNLIPSISLQVVTWNRKAFEYYKEEVFNKYPNKEHKIRGFKDLYLISYHAPNASDGYKEIITALETTYNDLKEIIKRKEAEEQTSNF